MDDSFYKRALEYHNMNRPGKIKIAPTKVLSNQVDLSLAYSPGVAAPCKEIEKNSLAVNDYTNRSNTVAVISNGTAVLGLGNIGPLASKPVMEGKAVLFNKFAGIDAIDIEIDQKDPKLLAETIASLAPTFGAINLEDIKAPDCFFVEKYLKEKLTIPVFHDDQHGTAIIVCAAIINALELVEKKISEVRLVVSGAGSAAIASLELLMSLGMSRQNIIICDSKGVVSVNRKDINKYKQRYATDLPYKNLAEVVKGADIFLGVSIGNVLTPEMLLSMAKRPIIMALSNPYPEIDPVLAKEIRPDVIIGTGRSDYPNQINNVLCFPFIFRGALDVGATTINSAMKKACVYAIAELAKIEISDVVSNAYCTEELHFGKNYLIPKPFDPRLIMHLAPAVAKAAMDSGVATKPVKDFVQYKHELEKYVYKSSVAMRPIFYKARHNKQNIIYVNGENDKVLRAAQTVADDGLGTPFLLGNKDIILSMLQKLKLRMKLNKDFMLVDTSSYDMQSYTPFSLAVKLLQDKTVDSIICGPDGNYGDNVREVREFIAHDAEYNVLTSASVLNTPKGVKFIADGYVNAKLDENKMMATSSLLITIMRYFEIIPNMALLSAVGCVDNAGSNKVDIEFVLAKLRAMFPKISVAGPISIDIAFDERLRSACYPNSSLKSDANVLIAPNVESANIAIGLLKNCAESQHIGPILLGLKDSVHVLSDMTTVRGIVNMSAFAAVDALYKKGEIQ